MIGVKYNNSITSRSSNRPTNPHFLKERKRKETKNNNNNNTLEIFMTIMDNNIIIATMSQLTVLVLECKPKKKDGWADNTKIAIGLIF